MTVHRSPVARRGKRCRLSIAAALTLGLVLGATPPAGAEAAGGSRQPVELHVATSGKDRWPGSERRPFRTLERAQEAVRARTDRMRSDIVVTLHRGTYELAETLGLSGAAGDSGANGHRVIYQANGYGTRKQDRVVVSGGSEVSGWKRADWRGNVWSAKVGWLDTRQLYVNGVRAERAFLDTALPGSWTKTETGYTVEGTVPQTWRNPQDIEFVYNGAFNWSEPRCGVAGISGDSQSTTITMDQPCFRWARNLFAICVPDTGLCRDNETPGLILPTRVENSLSFLTQPGTFHLDKSRPGKHVLYYRLRDGERMSRANVVAPRLETLINGEGAPQQPLENVSFRGLEFSYATWLGPNLPTGFVHFIGSFYEHGDAPPGDYQFSPQARHVPGNLAFHGARRIVFEGNRFAHLGGVGLELSRSSSENTIRGNEFDDISQTAITVGVLHPETTGLVTNNLIEHNHVHDIGVEYKGGAGIFLVKSQGTTVANNDVHDVAYSGISVDPVDLESHMPGDDHLARGIRILDNHVHDILTGLGDGGGIYLAGPQGHSVETGALVRGNVVHDPVTWPNIGIYTDEGSNWVSVDSNLVYGTVWVFGGGGSFSPVMNISHTNNFSDHDVYLWVGEAEAVPPVNHTLLGENDPAGACAAIPRCAGILNGAGVGTW